VQPAGARPPPRARPPSISSAELRLPVHRHDGRTTQPQVVLQCDLRVLHLTLVRLPAHLPVPPYVFAPASMNSPALPSPHGPSASYVISSFAEKQSCSSTTSTFSGRSRTGVALFHRRLMPFGEALLRALNSSFMGERYSKAEWRRCITSLAVGVGVKEIALCATISIT
jgi:hypothetical protein